MRWRVGAIILKRGMRRAIESLAMTPRPAAARSLRPLLCHHGTPCSNPSISSGTTTTTRKKGKPTHCAPNAVRSSTSTTKSGVKCMDRSTLYLPTCMCTSTWRSSSPLPSLPRCRPLRYYLPSPSLTPFLLSSIITFLPFTLSHFPPPCPPLRTITHTRASSSCS